MIERTLVIIKPDALERGIVGKIVSTFEEMKLLIEYTRMTRLSISDAERFYEHIKDISAFPEIISFMTSGTVLVMILSAENVIERVRLVVGSTSPLQALPGTIRFTFAESKGRNCVHASDSKESFLREVTIVAPDFKH